MKHIILIVLAITLTGCANLLGSAGEYKPLETARSSKRIDAVATLATNACEAQTAALYTANTVMLNRLRKMLDAGQIRSAQGVEVQAALAAARASTNAACGPDKQPTAEHIGDARAHLQRAWSMLKGAQP
jgi:hypothetical protein